MTEHAAPGRASSVTRPVIVAAVAGTFGLAFGAFLLSYSALRDLAELAGVPVGQAWLWPVIVDGVILEATISVVALRDGAPSARRFAWLLLVIGASASVAANITHAIVAADSRVPSLVAALVASAPPLVLVAMTHLTVELIRDAAPRAHGLDHPALVRVQSIPNGHQTVRELPGINSETEGDLDEEVPTADVEGPAVSGRDQRLQRRVEARRLAAQDVPASEIARRFGVHPTTVARWLHAPEAPEGSHQ